ncbi:LysM peptidoglycan-binding domain-containing protein [Falsigemmobacter faecalis]|nr:LysM peptidoglycan-binding domain-containing protein [Falsigemmobacter faecalis]
MGQKVAPFVWVAGGVAAALAALFFTTRGSPPETPVAAESRQALLPQGPAASVAVAPAPGAEVKPAAEPAPPAEQLPTAAVAPPEQEAAEPAPLAAPQIDTFSHGRDGSAVLAGRAPGSTRVDLLLGEDVLATAAPDQQGRFALLFDLAPSAQARSLILRAEAQDGRASLSAELLVAPAPAEALLAAAPGGAIPPAENAPPEGSSAVQTAAGAEPAVPAVPAQTAAQEAPAGPPTAPTSLLVSDSGIAVLRGPLAEGLSIDAIAYGAAGTVEVSGHSQPETGVRIYLDNEKHLDVKTDARGAWSADLPEVPPGLYTLRADQTAADGRVMARAETPFLRENPDSLPKAAVEERSGVITVQPGFTLWGIARESFGDGLHYVKVFEANRDQIRNPDLIYPGQIFSLPQN